MRIMIVDDEKLNVTLAQILLGKCEGVEVVGEFTHSYEALEAVSALQPDAIFVDIEMPQMNGIEFAKAVKEQFDHIQIIFVTAYESYALKAFEVEALHYLLKPLSEEKVALVVNRLFKYFSASVYSSRLRNTMHIRTFGRGRVFGPYGSEEIQWPTAKVRELFFIFVIHNGRELDKWELCEMLWPDSDSAKVEHRLHSTVSRLRVTLKEAGLEQVVMRNLSAYSGELSLFTCDLWELQKLMQQEPDVTEISISLYRELLEPFEGSWLAYEDWIWLATLSDGVMNDYYYALNKVVLYYMEQKKWREAELFNRKIIQEWSYEEAAIKRQLVIIEALYGQRELDNYYMKVVTYYEQKYEEKPTSVISEYERLRSH